MKDKIDKVFSCLSKKDPNPKTELIYYNEFTLLISIVLSAQSTDVGVNKATSNLFKIAKSPEDILNLGLEGVRGYIKSLGLYNSKAKNIMSLSRMLLVEYNGAIPTNVEALEKLPGVGSKTARVFLNCAYNFPLIAVDTHVFRVSKRLGIAQGSSPKLVEKELNEVVPKEWKVHAHHWLILHGRYICKARKPDCLNCVINKYCDFYMENS